MNPSVIAAPESRSTTRHNPRRLNEDCSTVERRKIPERTIDAFWNAASAIEVPVAGLVLDGDRMIIEPHNNDSPMLFDHLWCASAPAHWDGVVVISAGTVRESERSTPQRGAQVSVQVLLDRFGVMRSSIFGEDVSLPSSECSLEPEGALVDALMRFMGCPTAQEPRDVTHLVLTIWCDRLVTAALKARDQRPDIRAAVRLHPLVSGEGVPPSKEASTRQIADLTQRLASETNWERLRLLCADGVSQFGGVSATEAAWADAPMFARLLLDRYPSLFDLLDTLDTVASTTVSAWVRQTVGQCLDR